jgi:hypothetical protein
MRRRPVHVDDGRRKERIRKSSLDRRPFSVVARVRVRVSVGFCSRVFWVLFSGIFQSYINESSVRRLIPLFASGSTTS